MNLLTIASRANLGYSINRSLERARDQLREASDFIDLVGGTIKLTKQQENYHLATSLMGALGYVEAAMTDILIKYITCYPGHLEAKNVGLGELSRAGSIIDLIEEKAGKFVSDLAYKRFHQYSEEALRILAKGISISSGLIDSVAEIKATRDIYAHAGGIVNAVYLSKSGNKARERKVGTKLDLSRRYIDDSFAHLKDYLDELESAIPSSVKAFGRTATFRQMWEATTLERCLHFEDAWIIEDEDMVRPNNGAQTSYAWSHSEEMLLDFFVRIYNPEYPRTRHDLVMTLQRYPAQSNEHKVVQSWVECPFWF